jgi:L(+)-tartrate dehydratase beta subunit
MFDRGRTTRFDLRGHAVIHTAPNVKKVAATPEHPTGYAPVCIGTTTSARMERFTKPLMLQYGVRLVIGKGGLGAASLDAFREHGGAYLAIIGGTAALETTWIEAIEDVDLDDLNPESLWRFRIRGFGPLLVGMDSRGGSLYRDIDAAARARRAEVLASLGVKAT